MGFIFEWQEQCLTGGAAEHTSGAAEHTSRAAEHTSEAAKREIYYSCHEKISHHRVIFLLL